MATCDFSFLCSVVVIRDVPGVSNRVSIIFSIEVLRPLVLRVVPVDPSPGAGFWTVRLCSSVRVAFHAPRKQLSDQIGLTVIIGGPTTTAVSHAPAPLVRSRSVPSPGSHPICSSSGCGSALDVLSIMRSISLADWLFCSSDPCLGRCPVLSPSTSVSSRKR